MKELIIIFSKESKEALLVKKGSSFEILDSMMISSPEDVKGFLIKNRCSLKKATAILDDDTAVKGVTTPVMKPKDIEGFVRTNSAEYFALDQSEFAVDYRVIAREKRVNRMTMVLAAARRRKISEIPGFLDACSLKVDHVFLIEELLMNLALAEKRKSAAAVLISGCRASIAIVRDKGLFLLASFEEPSDEKFDISRITESITYYLSFYSKQNFGDTVEAISLIGDKGSCESVKEALEASFDGIIKVYLSDGKETDYTYLRGLQKASDAVLGKQLDYAYPGSRCQSTPFCRTMLHRIAAMTIITILLQAGLLGLGSLMVKTLENRAVQVSQIEASETQKELAALKEKVTVLEGDVKVIESLETEEDLIGKLYLIKDNIPKNIGVDSIFIDTKGMDIQFRMRDRAGSTLDAARLVLAINEAKAFEPISLEFLEMDDSIETFHLELKYREEGNGQ